MAAALTQTQGASDLYRGNQERRIQHGRERREHLSRTKLGEVGVRKRDFDPIQVLLNAREGRIAGLLPVKYRRMSASPFAFFRGSVSIMAADLSGEANTGIFVQLCGDAHVLNLGSFEGADGRLVFDINDFDETLPGPWEWDVKRMAASLALVGFESGHERSGCVAAVQAFAAAYCRSIEELADQPILVAARHQIHRLKESRAISGALQQSQRARPSDLTKKYAEKNARGQIQFKKVDGVLWRLQNKHRREILESLPLYRESLAGDHVQLFDFFRPVDVAFKIVGTGSVALRDYVVLMEGNGGNDLLWLQIKQEVASAYAPYLEHHAQAHQGERVVQGQRRIQAVSDLMLGWTRIGEHDFLVRQLNDRKGSLDLNLLRGAGLNSLAQIAGELLARGHARSGDALVIKGYLGNCAKVQKAIVRYGLDYARVAQADFQLFQKAIKQGRVKIAA